MAFGPVVYRQHASMASRNTGFNSPRVHQERYRSGYNGIASKAIYPTKDTWVRIPPSPHMFNFKKEKKEPKDLKEVLNQFKGLKEDFNKLSQEFNDLKENHQFTIQKIGLVRFNPFSEIGGDQSFSIALLDGNDDGLVITSFYTREGNRVYGKPIKQGNSQYALSKEENKAIEIAKKYGEKKPNLNNSAADSGGSGSH